MTCTLHLQPLRWVTRPLILLPVLSLGLGNGLQVALAAIPSGAASSLLPDVTILGRVIDERGQCLPGVNVVIKGTANGWVIAQLSKANAF